MNDWGDDDYTQDGIHAQQIDVADEGDNAERLQPEPQLYFGSVDEFVRQYLRNVYRRRIDGRHRVWAGEWWRYDEAVIRLEALWRAWEHLRLDPATGMSVWWRDHADHQMAALMDPDGPFVLATEGELNMSKRGEPLPYVAPPEGLFPDVRRTLTAGWTYVSSTVVENGGSPHTPHATSRWSRWRRDVDGYPRAVRPADVAPQVLVGARLEGSRRPSS